MKSKTKSKKRKRLPKPPQIQRFNCHCALPPDPWPSETRVVFDLSPQAVKIINDLLATGLYGLTFNEVVERLISEKLRSIVIGRLFEEKRG